MAEKVQQFVRRADDVINSTEQVRGVLLRFKKAIVRQSRLMESGTPAVEALEAVNASVLRQELVDALDEFEAHRQQMRVAFIGVALEDSANLSDVARALGVSRQLVSRLAADI